MKKFYSLVLMAAALLIGTNAWAADVTVVNETTGQSTTFDGSNALQSAIDYIGAGQTGTITLNNPITLDAAVVMPHVTGAINATNPNVLNRAGQNITLNLNGKNIQGANNLGVIQILKGSLDITGTGEINRGSGSGADNAKKSVITVYGAPWSNKSEVWTTLTVGENVTVKTEAAEKVYGICIQNSSALPTGVSTTTLGYTTSESVAIASAPTDKCWAPASSNTKASSGCAYGVKLFVNGKVFGNYRGINVLGSINAAPQCDINENIKTRQYDAYPYYDYNYPYVNVGSTAQVWCINDGVTNDNNGGIYGGGYAVYDISGYVHGQTGIYLKAGDLKLVDAVVASDSKTVGQSANYHNGDVAGSGIFIGTDAGYAGGTALTIEGDTKVSGGSAEGAKGIVDELATNAQSTGADISHVTVNGGTIEGGISMTQGGADVTTVYGAQITGEVVVDGETTTVASITPAGTHVTTVEINGKTTVIVSEGAGPQDDAKKTTWAEIAALSNKTAPADVVWTAVGEGTISSDLYFGELQMISGTDASNIQKLTINDGATLNVKNLMMNDFAQIIVEAGAKLIVNGEQGIIAPVAENIVLKSAAGKHAIFLFNPAVTSNKHPNATVQFLSKSFRASATNYQWERFGVPTWKALTSIDSDIPSLYTDIYVFEGNDWENLGQLQTGVPFANIARMNKPFATYNLLAYKGTPGATYTMKGELVGNENAALNTDREWNSFANSYVADVNIVTLLAGLESGVNIDHTVYFAKPAGLGHYTWDPLDKDWVTSADKIEPMQVFLLHNPSATPEASALNYNDMVYAPAISGPSSAPRRMVVTNDHTAKLRIIVANEEGVWDNVKMTEKTTNLHNATKYMNDDVNIYAMADEKAAILATENLENTYVGFSTINGGNFTISFANVDGRELTLIDHETGARVAIAEDNTYEFTAAANSVNDYRFEIVESAKLPTAIENTEAVKSAKGVYTITGQYVGEMNVWNTLPAGIYVVNGEKRVK